MDAKKACRKHNEAVQNVKAKGAQANNVKLESSKLKDQSLVKDKSRQKIRQASQLPSDFFDNHDSKRQKDKTKVSKSVNISESMMSGPPQTQLQIKSNHMSKINASSENQQGKGAQLPQGFFDKKDGHLRGITVAVKVDIEDEYKKFEKLIQEDLQRVDNRLEEEEYDAADKIQVAESVEQRTCRERVEILKKMAKSSMHRRASQLVSKGSSDQDSSSDDDSDDDDVVDWRAKHL